MVVMQKSRLRSRIESDTVRNEYAPTMSSGPMRLNQLCLREARVKDPSRRLDLDARSFLHDPRIRDAFFADSVAVLGEAAF